MSRPDLTDDATLDQWVAAHPRWRVTDGHLVAHYDIPYAQSVAVLAATEPVVDRLDHHPRVTVQYHELTVELWTHDRGGVTSLDLSLAEAFEGAVGDTATASR